ncbi:MAG: helix-hairpin-helix domain-containing protein [Pseudomonadota bacterium]
MFPTAPLLGVRWMMRDVVFGGPAADTPAAQESARLAVDAARVAATDAEAGAPAAAVEEARPSSPAKLRVVEGGGDKPAAAEEAAAPAATATPDDLQRIKGVGPRLAEMLRGQGVTTFAQIAAMTDADLDALDEKLGAFRGRSKRDDWVSQAKALMAG